jgi:uncharacterized cupin superfamily protein
VAGTLKEVLLGKIDVQAVAVVKGTRYPAPFDAPCKLRENIPVGLAAGLTQFGVNITRLAPGVWSSQRHWHSHEDEFVYVLEGEVTLVTDAGEEALRAGDCAGFKAGERNGHCLKNLSQHDAVILTVGSRNHEDSGEYSDIDMKFLPGRYTGGGGYTRKDDSPL